jgi:signal recognition particle subunit SRP54
VLSLVEEMERKFDKKKTAEMSQKMMEGKDFDLEDFKSQIAQMRSMGGMLGLMDKLPGMNSMPDEVKDKMDDKIIYRMEAIINSMTPKERRDPDIIKGSRKKRIADGAGVEVAEVTRLLHQFNAMKKMMRKLRSQGGIRKLINLARTMAGNGGMGGFFG